jgi:single-strand DNA-binding protein
MRAFNQIILMGNAAADPEILASKSGKTLAIIPLAVDRQWPESIDETERDVDYHRVVAWNKLADIAKQYIKKGSKMIVKGQLLNHCYEGQEGKHVYQTEIHADQIEILTWKTGEEKQVKSTKIKTKEKVTA